MTLTPASMQYHLWQGPRSPAHFRSERLRWILLSEQDANASFSFNFLNATFWECTRRPWKLSNLHCTGTSIEQRNNIIVLILPERVLQLANARFHVVWVKFIEQPVLFIYREKP